MHQKHECVAGVTAGVYPGEAVALMTVRQQLQVSLLHVGSKEVKLNSHLHGYAVGSMLLCLPSAR